LSLIDRYGGGASLLAAGRLREFASTSSDPPDCGIIGEESKEAGALEYGTTEIEDDSAGGGSRFSSDHDGKRFWRLRPSKDGYLANALSIDEVLDLVLSPVPGFGPVR
jgi:hypothetical protein